MIDFARYLSTSYVQGSRGPDSFDCWGLVREILATHYGVPEGDIPSFGHVPDRKAELTKCKEQIQHKFTKGDSVPGSIACHVRRGILFHVGVVVSVDNVTMVLHTSNKYGPALDSLKKFSSMNSAEYFTHAAIC